MSAAARRAIAITPRAIAATKTIYDRALDAAGSESPLAFRRAHITAVSREKPLE